MTLIDSSATAAMDVAARVAAVRQVYDSGRTKPIAWRLRQLDGIERFLTDREGDIAEALMTDLGRNPHDTWFGEIVGTKGAITHIRKHLRRWTKSRRRRVPLIQLPSSAWVQYEPLGVVLVIGPWNYPVLLSLAPVIEAIAAGNAVVLKPSEVAPATSALLGRLLPEYVDREAVIVVEGDGATTQELLALGFDHAFFTGGTEIGKKIMVAAAATLTPVTLELGGKSPVIVAADADLDILARRLAWLKILNSGQTCIAPDYVLVDRTVADALVAKVTAAFTAMRMGEPDTLRIVNERQFDRIAGYLSATKGTVAFGGSTDRETLGIAPTIVRDPTRDEPLMENEIFGPVLPVIVVDSVEEAIRYVNDGQKPLAVYVFSASRTVARHIIDSIPSGGAVINHIAMHFLIPGLPFGGVGASGMGSYHGEDGFETFSHRKAVLAKPFKPDLRAIYPPYTERAKKVLRRLF